MIQFCVQLLLACLVSLPVFATSVATLSLSTTVTSIDEISVNGALSFLINSATAGLNPDESTSSSLTYSLSTNNSSRTIQGCLTQPLPNGVELQANFSAPAGGSSLGAVSLSTVFTPLVTGIARGSYSNLSTELILTATEQADSQVLSNSFKVQLGP